MNWLSEEEIARADLRYDDGAEFRYDPEQARDENGKWSAGGGTDIGGGTGGPRAAYAPRSSDMARWEKQGIKFSKSWTPQDQLKHEAQEPLRMQAAKERYVPSTLMTDKEKAAWTEAHPPTLIATVGGKEQGDTKNYTDHQLEEHFRRGHGEALKLNPSRAELEAAHSHLHEGGAIHVHSGGAPRPETHYVPMPTFGHLPIPGFEDYQTDEGHGSVPGSGK